MLASHAAHWYPPPSSRQGLDLWTDLVTSDSSVEEMFSWVECRADANRKNKRLNLESDTSSATGWVSWVECRADSNRKNKRWNLESGTSSATGW